MVADYSQYQLPDFSWVLSQSLNPYGDTSLRVPMYLTSSLRERQGVPGVSMSVNPNTVSFRQGKRITERKTQGGTTFMHWTDSTGRNNDILSIDFRGQTGNINFRRAARLKYDIPGASKVMNFLNDKLNDFEDWALSNDNVLTPTPVDLQRDMSGVTKLVKFWDLHRLTTEPVKDEFGNRVIFSIYYSSPLFGNMFVKFMGHFNKVLDFEDTADSPFNKVYTFGLTVEATQPSINQIYEAISFNIGQQFNNNLG
jgi:hypothetical protein